MSYSFYSDEEEKLQKLLIPLNIVVAVLALVAAISLLVAPLLKIDFGKVAEAVVSMTGGESSESDEGSSDSPYAVIFDSVDAELVISPIGMAKVLFAPADKKGATLLNELVLSKEIIEGISVSAVNMMLVAATKDVDASNMDKIDMPALNEALIKVDGAKSEGDVLKVLDDYLAVLEKQDVTITDDMKEAAKEHTLKFYNDTVEATGGDFSVEKMICVNMSPDGKVYDNYTDLVAGMLNGDFSSEGSDNPLSSVAEMMNMIAAPYGLGFIYIAFNALIWFILFLFAFIRLFTKNKRFTMWYVKLVGCWPCIIFFLVPFAMGKAAASIAGLAPLAGLFGAITSFTWISGLCYLLLWAFSICWAFPIKHKIRKLRKGGE